MLCCYIWSLQSSLSSPLLQRHFVRFTKLIASNSSLLCPASKFTRIYQQKERERKKKTPSSLPLHSLLTDITTKTSLCCTAYLMSNTFFIVFCSLLSYGHYINSHTITICVVIFFSLLHDCCRFDSSIYIELERERHVFFPFFRCCCFYSVFALDYCTSILVLYVVRFHSLLIFSVIY